MYVKIIRSMKVVFPLMALLYIPSVAWAERLINDPTRPAYGIKASEVTVTIVEPFLLSSLMTGKKVNRAVINGQKVRVGDIVDGANVVSITQKGVLLEMSGDKKFISLVETKGFIKVKSYR